MQCACMSAHACGSLGMLVYVFLCDWKSLEITRSVRQAIRPKPKNMAQKGSCLEIHHPDGSSVERKGSFLPVCVSEKLLSLCFVLNIYQVCFCTPSS